jgi:formylglycine-generating enzyme required for sulfatase activity/tRNA A-37 threonylcarbamoyl transferase component Bud32
MIEVTCEQCGVRMLVPPTVQGRTGVCFGCGAPLTVPQLGPSPRADSLAFNAGDHIAARYVIQDRVGQGGMGVVYRAHDTLINETVALKFLHPGMLRTEKGKQLFIREAQIARRLRHENIVAVHDVSWTGDGVLYLSMEFAEGQSLRAFLRKHRNDRRLLPVRLAVTFTRQILTALEYAHRTVVHRDMKPENVILLASERIKVLDFGLAKAVHEELFRTEDIAPSSKRVVGTLAYAAPEQKKLLPIDLRADIYAVGLILYELLTLRTPLDDFIPVAQARKDVAPSLLAVLDKALCEEKERRWQSAGEFRNALENAFEGSYRKTIHVNTEARSDKPASTEGMVFLEGGLFLMGNNDVREESPEEEVFVGPFWMDKFPVTVVQYAEYLRDTGAPEPRFWRDPQCNGPNQPVVGVSWAEANAYAGWAGKLLPTEAQWEFAARGRDNRKYPWGDLPPDTTRANYREYLGMPSIVTMHDEGRTPEGIYDLAGNVLEWTIDPFASYATFRRNPEGSEASPRRAVRGGCWNSRHHELLCTFRKGLFPEVRDNTVGFRCVLPAEDRCLPEEHE